MLRLLQFNNRVAHSPCNHPMVGALEGEHWLHVAKHEKGQLLMGLEGYKELEELLNSEGVTIEI
ncbi:hypothetical protein [Pseudomonas sp.]|uniref:hypothetical protein n=1 Tax=Pseudomonas sp. TaxID=306 RepID=UPI0039827381